MLSTVIMSSFTTLLHCSNKASFVQEPVEDAAAALGLNSRFPTPSSNPRGMQGSAAVPVLAALSQTTAALSAWGFAIEGCPAASNPWGLQETALPLLDISHPEGAVVAEVTYTPIEELLADVSTKSQDLS